MENDEEQIKSLIDQGEISSALGSLIIGKSNKRAFVARVAIFASLKARENALRLNFSRVIERNHALYEVGPDGTESLIKVLPKSSKQIPKTFKLN